MADPLSFDELLDLASRDTKPLEVEVKSLGRKVYIRNPSSADVDAFRWYAARNNDATKPISAKLVQLMLCDQFGEHIVPQTDEALEALAQGNPKVMDEIALVCMPLVKEPGEDDIEKEKNS